MTIAEKWLYEGRRLHDAGQLGKAAGFYQRVLKRDPNNADALFFLGSLMIAKGNYDLGVECLEKVVNIRPNWSEARNNLGTAYQYLGNYSKSLEHYDKACEIRPDFTEALNNRSILLTKLMDVTQALENINQVLAIDPANVDAYINRAVIYRSMKENDKAKTAIAKAYECSSTVPATLRNIADVLATLGEFQLATECYLKVLDITPKDEIALVRLAAALGHLADNSNRADCLNRMLILLNKALEINPLNVDALNNKSAALQQQGKYQEAEECLLPIIDVINNHYELLINYGSLLMSRAKYTEAIECMKKAIEINPNGSLPYYNWGASLYLNGDFDEAYKMLNKSLSINPNCTLSHAALSLMNLLLGKYEEGWKEYEWRRSSDQFTGRIFEMPIWNGGNLNGKRILLHSEQGYGDLFQFIRYAPIVKSRGGTVVVECHDNLKQLIGTCPGIDEIFERQDVLHGAVVRYDEQANLLSLPYIFKTDYDTIPAQVPYLQSSEERRQYWAERLSQVTPADTRLKVGIVWAGNPDHRNDFVRSTTLDKFGILSGIHGVTFYSLQKGAGESQLSNPPANIKLVALGSELNTFDDTAGLLDNLDLVISVDTSIVHLAGALGLPVWTIVQKVADFRWLMDRIDTPWYPTMRIFRQKETLNYDPVFEAVREQLEQFAHDPVQWEINDSIRKFNNGDRDCAKVQLFAIAQRHPSDVRVLNALSEILMKDGNTEEALNICITALQINPFDRTSVKNSASILAAFGQKNEAGMLYKNYLSTNPNDIEFQEALTKLNGGLTLVAA